MRNAFHHRPEPVASSVSQIRAPVLASNAETRPRTGPGQAAEVSRAIAARKASMSFSVVSKLHIQRTSFFAASQS